MGTTLVPTDELTIQDVVDNANPGDTICVDASLQLTYLESVVVFTDNIIIVGINGTPIVSPGSGLGFALSGVTGVTIDNFDITGFNGTNDEGIFVSGGSTMCTIENNIIDDNTVGIFFDNGSDNHTVQNNMIDNNGTGILIDESEENMILDNMIENNTSEGILLRDSANNNTIDDNTIDNNEDGIVLDASEMNMIQQDNIITNNNSTGILLRNNSNVNLIDNNTVQNNSIGILLDDSLNNTIENNLVQFNIGMVGTQNFSISKSDVANFAFCDKEPVIGMNCYQVKAVLLTPVGMM
ncbi:right-handed parallel beta-helix repeat-containing protein [Chengkuizengella axinellae]|uniref:NosD domain-containing protein n=1 Tax=Chengkuizengella axinellae TaxID=3064388 RepID=A0ABT9IV48_9BACL|nr:NosD domain-containing protein [Chengkuizengella sp. 2205SS18-9]MDP5273192.1 NosD domain-containing protein [Chengkuizengella sp. 2205SS18-9]